jgi:type IV secretion system protein TrbG
MNKHLTLALFAATALAVPAAAQVPKLPTPTMLPRVPLANEPLAKAASLIPATPTAITSTAPRKQVVKPKPKRQRPQAHGPTSQVNKANGSALREPTGFGYLNAIQVYPYQEGQLYRLYAAPEQVSDIALQAGEALVSVAAGDTVRWIVGDTTSGSGANRRTHILMKPSAPGLKTNLVISTDRRVYHLALESTERTAMAALSWNYPQDELMAIERATADAEAQRPIAEGLALEQLNFNYRISGDDPSWRPLRAFDDGRQTFIAFPPSISVGEVPPLFVTGAKGEAQLVNYRMRGDYYVVDRLFDAAELRLGEKHQDIVRITRGGGKKHRRNKEKGS